MSDPRWFAPCRVEAIYRPKGVERWFIHQIIVFGRSVRPDGSFTSECPMVRTGGLTYTHDTARMGYRPLIEAPEWALVFAETHLPRTRPTVPELSWV